MRDPLTFRKADPVVSTSEVRAAVVATGLPKGWTWADDLAMLNKAFAAFSLTAAEAERFTVLRKALTGDGYLNLTLQLTLFDVIKDLAGPPPTTSSPMATGPFDDHCRTCHGSGKIREPGERGTVIVSTCYACGGSGHGK